MSTQTAGRSGGTWACAGRKREVDGGEEPVASANESHLLERSQLAPILDPALLAAAENELVLRVPTGTDVVERMRVGDGYPARVTKALVESFPAVVGTLVCVAGTLVLGGAASLQVT